jgi:iron complex outermembrane recepter protein
VKSCDRFLRSKLSSAVSLALAASCSVAYAQETTGSDESANAPEELVITGFRRSLEDSLAIKQASDSIVEAVSAEDIGKLPDVSIAESLARLPGLTAQRLNGRGQVISVRGLSPDFTNTLLNGREQVSTSDNRSVEFDQYPSELLSGAVVYKTPDASIIGQGLAATVDLRTIRPLAHGKRDFAANLRYEKTELGSLNAGSPDDGWRYSLSYIDQFADNRIGVALGYAHLDNPSQEERFNSWGYPTLDTGEFIIGGAKPYVRSGDLERNGVIGVLEFKPSDTFSSAVDVYYSDFTETQQLRGIEMPLFWGGAPLEAGYTATDGLVTAGTFDNVKGVMRNDLNMRSARVKAVGWNNDFALGGQWHGGTDISYSRVDRTDLLLETYSGTGPAGVGATDNLGFTLDSKGTVFNPTLNYADPNLIMLTSPQGWGGDIVPGGQLGYDNNPNIDDELDQLRLKARRDIGHAISGVEFGVNLSTREKSLDEDEFFLALASGLTAEPIPTVTGTTDLSFLGIPGMVSYDPLALINAGVYDLTRNPNADVVVKSWQVQEDVNIAYVKFDLDTDWGVPVKGNFGVQIVDTDQSSHAQAASGTGSGTFLRPLEGGKTYTDVLPSLNLNFSFAYDQYLRMGIARTLSRARMDDLRASAQYSYNEALANDPTQSPWSGTAGNPELDPWIANSIDFSYEKYFAGRAGYFSAAVFYKDLESYIFLQPTVFDFTGFPHSGPDPVLNQGIVSAPANGNGGKLDGIEFAISGTGEMLTPALTGFGAIFTMSFNDSSVKPDPNSPAITLPGFSKRVGNLTLYYENHGFSARISDRYRTEFLGEVAGFGNGRNYRTVDDESVVDAQIGYSFSGALNGLTLLLQAQNLTDEPFVTHNPGESAQVIDYQRYGRSYLLGVSYRR